VWRNYGSLCFFTLLFSFFLEMFKFGSATFLFFSSLLSLGGETGWGGGRSGEDYCSPFAHTCTSVLLGQVKSSQSSEVKVQSSQSVSSRDFFYFFLPIPDLCLVFLFPWCFWVFLHKFR
jgi:hypothetical protein